MSEQSEALRLADELDTDGRPGGLCGASATVLRRQHSRIEADEALMRPTLAALEEGRDALQAEAEHVHEAYRGYYPDRHKEADAAVARTDAAITALRKRLESST